MNSSTNKRSKRDSVLSSSPGSDWSKPSSKRVHFGTVTEITMQRQPSSYSRRPKTNEHQSQPPSPPKRSAQTTDRRPSPPRDKSRPSVLKDNRRNSYPRDKHRLSILDCYRHVLPGNMPKSTSTQRDQASAWLKPSQSKRVDASPPPPRHEQKPQGVRYTYVILGGRASHTSSSNISVR